MTESQDNTINANLTPLPDRVGVDGLEDKWRGVWDESGVYKFQGTRDRKAVYSIDTPPPTVSGHLHVGHVFSYTHTDVIARFKRMNGYDVFYPMGWDDNGLPTERRVQNYYGVRVDTSLKYDPNFVPPFEGTDGKKIDAKDQVPISRKNFIELCEKLTAQDEKQFEALWRSLGLSIDWSQTYHTIGEHPQRVAQKAFLRNLARGEAYQKDAPGLWDVTFQTAVAQAELESREYPGFYHKLAFRFEDGTPIYIETTRPELLAACGALIAHPDDERYKQYFGQYVYSPLFHVKVPILAHKAAEMDKGAGIAMCCTFGDVTDVEWWRDLNLPLRSIIQRNGRIVMDTPDWIEDEEGKRIFQETAGKTTFSARKRHRRRAARCRRSGRRADPDQAYDELLREGRQAARNRHLPPVVPEERRHRREAERRAHRARQGAELPPRFHARALRELGARPQRRLADLPPALLRRSVPAVVPGEGGWHPGLRSSDHPERGPSADRSDRRCAGRLHRGPA